MQPVLEIRSLEKAFGGVPVLRDVSFAVAAGEVVALAGENGAGKSTLFKIVTGRARADAGSVLVDGVALTRNDPRTSREHGIGIVPQELAPYPDLLVYENLFVGREIRSRFGILQRPAMARAAAEMLEVFGVTVDPSTTMNHLSTALIQIVEIIKATTWGARVILLDEPTSSMPDQEVERLYSVIRTLQSRGVAMVYTTHRMKEIQDLADRVVVMRDGLLVMDAPVEAAPEEAIFGAMIGRSPDTLFPELAAPTDEVGLRVVGIVRKHGGPSVDLVVRKGEILGLGGLVGAGRTELVEAIFGTRRYESGRVEVYGAELRPHSPRAAIDAGVAIVPEDRKRAGLVLSRSVLDNASLPHLTSYARAGWIRGRVRRKAIDAATTSVRLKARSIDQLTETLSGGNQQKVVIARWLRDDTTVLLLDEPTRGVDVGARGEIYAIIRDMATSGLAVILISSDMPELIGLSHRVLVMRAGGISGELSRDELARPDAQEKIFRLASDQALLDVT